MLSPTEIAAVRAFLIENATARAKEHARLHRRRPGRRRLAQMGLDRAIRYFEQDSGILFSEWAGIFAVAYAEAFRDARTAQERS